MGNGKLVGVMAFLGRLLSIGLCYLLIGQENPIQQYFFVPNDFEFQQIIFLHQLTCQYYSSCACSYPDGKQGTSFSSDSDD